MKKEILIVKNISREGPGLLETVLDERKVGFTVIDLDLGEDFPPITNYKALVVLGGPDSANDKNRKIELELTRIREALNVQIPYLGICLGLQVLVKAAGGEVVQSPVKEIGFTHTDGNQYTVELTEHGKRDPLFSGLNSPFDVFHLHGETVGLIGEMTLLGVGNYCPNQVVRVGANAYGIQCHFELTHQMLNTWIEKDPDLQKINTPDLLKRFEIMKDEYTRIGKHLFRNFLTIAGY